MAPQELKNSETNLKIFPEAVQNTRSRRPRFRSYLVQSTDGNENMLSHWEAMFLSRIVNSTCIRGGREYRTYWCAREDLINEFNEPLLKQLKLRGAIEEWIHPNGLPVVTLTPWCASILGFRLAEYWVRHIDHTEEYRGPNRRPVKIRIQRWDTEPYWTYINRPERSLRIPGNTCELPLIGDPEDKSYRQEKHEYLEDWQTWKFTHNPTKAMTIKIRVGSFVHEVIVQRDRRNSGSHPQKKRKP